MTTHDTHTPTHAGIDYSITSPAIWIGNTGFAFGTKARRGTYDLGDYQLQISAYPVYKTDEDRHAKLAEWALGILTDHGIKNVTLEDYAYNARGRSVFQIGECTGCLKQALRTAHISLERMSPTVVKKVATGSGGADKRSMIAAFERETGIDLFDVLDANRSAKTISGPTTDLVDAYWLCQLGNR